MKIFHEDPTIEDIPEPLPRSYKNYSRFKMQLQGRLLIWAQWFHYQSM
jgi:hypothetical protein